MKKKPFALLTAVLALFLCAAAPDYGTVNIVSSSHQDTAWMDTPAYCRNFRIEKNIIPALEMMKKDPNYKFSMECMLHLMEFLEAHPERKDEIIELTRQGRFEWGATYNQPYESWLTGEELVRQVYYGRRWLKKNFPGCDSRVAFNPDVPARALQMQQILAKSGVPYLFGSRYTEGLYNWESPDGSGIIFYSPAHYSKTSRMIGLPAPLAAWRVNMKLRQLGPYYLDRGIPPAYCLINSDDFSRPKNFNPLINLWNGPFSPWCLTERMQPPTMRYSSAAEFFDAVSPAFPHLDKRMGERPDVWLYITGPTHHKFSVERRQSAAALSLAETSSVIAGLFSGGFSSWPRAVFDQAWMNQLYIDHGIGGKNGHITDEFFSRKLREAKDLTAAAADPFIEIASRLKSAILSTGRGILLFNNSSSPVNQPVTVGIPGEESYAAGVVDSSGAEVPSQITMVSSELPVKAASATADSTAGKDYGPENAIDGRWEVGESHPELGESEMWQSKPGPGLHWLVVDLGKPEIVHQVVIRHYGCIGRFGFDKRWTTADFRVQGAESNDGPWIDLVSPVHGNGLPLTAHSFAPRSMRFIRLYITRGTQLDGDGAARVLELQAFGEPIPPVPRLIFMAIDVPSFGYATYSVEPGRSSEPAPNVKAGNDAAENDFYRVTFAPGGVKSIYDKQEGRELLNTEKWLAGEVFTMLSVAPKDRITGTDAGEFGSMPLPVMDGSFDRVANHKPEWKLIETGPVRSVYQSTAQLADAEVRQRVSLWHGIKRIDFDVDLINFNGRPWREFRAAFPLAMDKPEITYEVPMGVVRVGRDEIKGIGGHAYGTLNYTDDIPSIHPREVQRFIDASDVSGGVSLWTGIPVFDWIDPTGQVDYPVIQPVLLASRKSCNIQGNWYPQAGDHHYHFTLSSHNGDWTNGWRQAVPDQNLGITLELLPGQFSPSADLPSSLSFFSLSAPNVMITAIKKAEDDDEVVVRMVEMEGKDTEVTLHTWFKIESASRTDLIEENPVPIPAGEHDVTTQMGHHSIETIKLKLSR